MSVSKKKYSRLVSEYSLVWFDEFDGDSLDASKWSTDTRMANTDELFQDNSSAVQSVTSGELQLNAVLNQYYDPNGDTSYARHKYVTTNSVTTENKMSFKYGYLEIRAKVPYKEGCWPSFWLRSHRSTGKQENPNFEVEVDIFEVFSSKTSLDSNLHQQNYGGDSSVSYMTTASAVNAEETHTFENAENLSNEYHTYGFEWSENRMAIYVDRVLQCEWIIDEQTLAEYGLQPDTSGFDTTMNILFNNHLFTASSDYIPLSGDIIENNEENLPAQYHIDWVRLYQKDDGLSQLIIGQ